MVAAHARAEQAATPAAELELSAEVAPRPLSESLIGDAKRAHDAARLLFDSGDYAGALLKFEAAHELSGDPRLLWNAAVCEKNLRRYARAIALVERYLASNSPLISASAAASARAFLEAATPLTARLAVEANVKGATVELDGVVLGKLPLDPKTRIDLGMHALKVKKFDFVSYEETLTVTDSGDLRVVAKLIPIAHEGRLVIHAGEGDTIAIDGKVVGSTNWQGTLKSGRHQVRITAPGALPFRSDVVVTDNQSRTLDVTLKPEPGSAIPGWVWIAGGVLIAGGLGTASYFLLRPSDSEQPRGSLGHVELSLEGRR